MKALFAPWRLDVIEEYKKADGCILCNIYKSQSDAESLVLARAEKSFVVMNKYPYTNGHLMVIPQRHVAQWDELNDAELLEINQLSQKAVSVMKKEFSAQGFNLGVNLGEAGGAGIDQHVHMHVVPRWVGDTNFMPAFSDVKIISEHLKATYAKLKKAWED